MSHPTSRTLPSSSQRSLRWRRPLWAAGLLLVLSFSSASFAAPPDIPFGNDWAYSGQTVQSGDIVTLTGSGSGLEAATVSVPNPADGRLCFVVEARMTNVVPSDEPFSGAKLKGLKDGTKIGVSYLPTTIQGAWMTVGFDTSANDREGAGTVGFEVSLQASTGTLELRNPRLCESAPAPDTTYPFEVPADTHLTVDIDSSALARVRDAIFDVNSKHIYHSLDWGDQALDDLYRDIGFRSLRFPGGTAGNKYDWETDKWFAEYSERGPFSFDGYAALAVELEAKSVLMFNMIHGTVEDQGDRLRDRLEAGLDISWIELGNEHYFGGEQRGNVPTTAAYIDYSRATAAELKSIEPSLRVAVTAYGQEYDDPGSWDGQLIAAKGYYDGIVLHPYQRADSFFVNPPAIAQMLGAGRGVRNVIDGAHEAFGVPLILTEWGLLGGASTESFYSAIAIADMLIEVVKAGDAGKVEQAGLHLMVEGSPAGRLFYNDDGTIWATQWGVVYRRLLKELIGSSSHQSSSSSAELLPGIPAVSTHVFRDRSGNLKLVAVNALPEAATLSPSIDGEPYAGALTLETYTETELATNDTLYALTDTPWQSSGHTSAVELPPFSVNLLTLDDEPLVTAPQNPGDGSGGTTSDSGNWALGGSGTDRALGDLGGDPSDPNNAGCGCTTVGSRPKNPWLPLVALLGAGLVLMRRRQGSRPR